MKSSTLIQWPAAFCAALALLGRGDKKSDPMAAGDAPVIRVDGSSTVFPIAEARCEALGIL
jgi:ABC-type phosphate transport system substrate-binding protein